MTLKLTWATLLQSFSAEEYADWCAFSNLQTAFCPSIPCRVFSIQERFKHFYIFFMFFTKAYRWSAAYILLTLHPGKNLQIADLLLTCELVHGALAVSNAAPWSGHIAAGAPWWSCGQRGRHTACRRQALCEPHRCCSACLCHTPQWSPQMVQKGRSGETCAKQKQYKSYTVFFFLFNPLFSLFPTMYWFIFLQHSLWLSGKEWQHQHKQSYLK